MALFKKEKGNLYLVDYENIHDTGLLGMNTLEKNDSIIILFGSQDKTIGLGSHLELMESKANVETIRLEKSGKNYLDFQLVTYLGFLIGTGKYDKYFVISNDKGFDSVLDFWRGRGVTIERLIAIKPELVPVKEIVKKQNNQQRRTNVQRKIKQNKVQKQPGNADKKAENAKETVIKGNTGAENKVPENKAPEKKPLEKKSSLKVKLADNQEVKPVEEIKPVGQKTKRKPKSKAMLAVAEIPEGTRKKVRGAVKDFNIGTDKYTVIYKAIALSNDQNAYKSRITSAFADNSKEIYEATLPMWNEFRSIKENSKEV